MGSSKNGIKNAAAKSVRRFSRLFLNEIDRFFTLKTILPFLILTIVMASITVPIYNYVNPFDPPSPPATEDFISGEFDYSKLATMKKRLQEYEKLSDYEKDEDYIRLKKEYELQKYLIENNQLSSSGKDKQNYLYFTMYFVLALYLFQLIFAAFTVRQEYRHKNSLSLFTSPAGRSNLFFSKWAGNVTFAFLLDSVFFIVLAIAMAGYKQYLPVFLIFGYSIAELSPAMTLFLYYLTTLLASVFVVSLSMAAAVVIKNNFLVIPICIGLFVCLPFYFSIAHEDLLGERIWPFSNLLLIPLSLYENNISYAKMNTPEIASASLIISSALCCGAGVLGYKLQQHKE